VREEDAPVSVQVKAIRARRLNIVKGSGAFDKAGFDALQKRYGFRDLPAVRRYLQEHPDLIPFLLEAHPCLQRAFGREVETALEVVTDPEGEHGHDEEIFAYVVTGLPVDEALTRLGRFDDDWFLGQVPHVAGRLNFDLEQVAQNR